MNDNFQRWFERFRAFLADLSSTKKIMLGIVGALIVTGTVVGVLFAKHDPYQVLYSDLQPEDSRAVAKKLSEQNIPYRMSEDSTVVYVPVSKVHPARMEMAKAGIPGQDVVGLEKFDSSTLGMSSYVQRIQYIRAIQGELTRSINQLESVKHARVHISVPPKKTFLEDQEPPKASVVLDLKPGQQPSKAEITGIAHLVASAVEGLHVNQVTIVDTKGGFLRRPDDDSNGQGLSTHLLEMQRSIENDYQKRIEELLTPVVGLGKVRAKVTAEMDPSRVNTTEESYDPDKTVVRNALKNDETSNGSKPNPIGIPGSRSNLPGTEANNPPIPMANTSTEKNMQNTTYAIPKKVQTIDKPSGSIKRLTVAVVVDGYYAKTAGQTGTESFSPRSEEELKRLQDIVANAVGYDTQRRDAITVSSLPFRTTDIGAPEEVETPITPAQQLVQQAIRNGLIAVVVLLFFFMVVRPFLRWATLGDVEKEVAFLPKTVAELETARRDQSILALTQAANTLDESEPLDKKEEADLRRKIVNRLEDVPRKGYRVVQDWLEEDSIATQQAAAA